MSDTGHWKCAIKFNPEQFVGFIYVITNKLSGKKYIGRKQFQSKRRKQVKMKTDPTRKKTEIQVKESDWKTYTGSSTSLNADIEKLGKDKFRFEIISLHKTLSSLNYAEVYTLVKANALTSYFKNGEPAFYNGMIPTVKTRPTMEEDSDEDPEDEMECE